MPEISAFNTIYREEIYQIASPVTIVIGTPWHEIGADQRLLLSKILQALRLSVESVNIIHQGAFDLSMMAVKPKRMIAFIAPPKGLASYEAIITGETTVVFADSLEILNNDDTSKRQLWNTLKAVFSQ